MVRCKCGQEFKTHDEWKAHYSSLRPPYPFMLMVERGLIKRAEFLKMKRNYEKFAEEHKEVR